MNIVEEIMDEVTVLKFQGRLDSNSAATVKDRIKSCINERRLQLVVDMGDVDFVDSSGLGSLVYSLRMIDKAGGAIRISAVQDRVRAVFELTKLHHLFEIYDDAGAAVRAFR
jgi:anti-sigma B factor antagonist